MCNSSNPTLIGVRWRCSFGHLIRTPVSPAKLSETVAVICRVLSNAVIDLAAHRHRQHIDGLGKDEEV